MISSDRKLLPHYNERIEELRGFRNRYDSIITRVRQLDGRVRIVLPDSPEKHGLAALNRDLEGRLEATDEGYFVPEDKKQELLVEMEAISEYADDRIKSLKRREVISFTTVTTFTIILLLNVFNIPFH
jgi:hypothetical protein